MVGTLRLVRLLLYVPSKWACLIALSAQEGRFKGGLGGPMPIYKA